VAILGVIALGVAACGDGDSSDVPDGVAAQVGDARITFAALERALEQAKAQAQGQGASFPEEDSDAYDQVRRQAMQDLVLQRVVEAEGRKCGTPCAVPKEDVDEELDRIKEQSFNGSDAELNDYLEQVKLTMADARRILRFQILRELLYNRVTRGVRFTGEDAREYYEANKAQFRQPAGRSVSHILVEEKAEADRIRAEVTSENFADLARQYSIDTGTKEQGGSLGVVQRGSLTPEFEKVAFALANGEISQPVQTQFGWDIIKVDVTPARTTPFAEALPQIRSQQLTARRNEAFQAWQATVLDNWGDRITYADESLEPPEAQAAGGAAQPQTTTSP
jgi:foldase protein PrsA